MPDQPCVLTERRERVLVVTINRPAQRNAIDAAVAEGIGAAMDELDADDALLVGVLHGADGYFSSGMDLKAFAAGGAPPYGPRGFAGLVERPPAKVLIAAIEGFALAGGLEIALACDLIVAAEGARLGIPEVKRSLVAAAGALLRLPRRIPYHTAMEMALTGEPISAERAAGFGLVNRVVPTGGALSGALELAEAVVSGGPLALAATKRILVEQQDWPADEAWARQAEIAGAVRDSQDAREGARAFAEKRDAVWRGR